MMARARPNRLIETSPPERVSINRIHDSPCALWRRSDMAAVDIFAKMRPGIEYRRLVSRQVATDTHPPTLWQCGKRPIYLMLIAARVSRLSDGILMRNCRSSWQGG